MSQSQEYSSPDYYLSASLGNVKDAAGAVFTASNLDMDTGTEDMIPLGGTYTWLAAATNVELVSNSALDTAAGTGARTVRVLGLNYRRLPIAETVVLNGLTPVPLTQQYLRINTMQNLTAGSGTLNAGDIVARPLGGGATISQIPIGFGRSQMGIYTIPANRIAYLVDAIFNITSGVANDQVSFQLLSRAHNGAFFSRAVVSATAATPTIIPQLRLTGMYGSGDDILIKNNSLSASNVQCHGTVALLLIQATNPLIL